MKSSLTIEARQVELRVQRNYVEGSLHSSKLQWQAAHLQHLNGPKEPVEDCHRGAASWFKTDVAGASAFGSAPVGTEVSRSMWSLPELILNMCNFVAE